MEGDSVIAIAGVCRSGTSFVAECFNVAGMPTGGGWSKANNAGREEPALHGYMLVAIAKSMRFLSCAEAESFLQETIGEGSNTQKQKLVKLCPEGAVRKSPLFAPLLELLAHAEVLEEVIIPLREPADIMHSLKVWNAGKVFYVRGEESPEDVLRQTVDYAQATCRRHNIPMTLLRFPEVVEKEGEDFYELSTTIARIAGLTCGKAEAIVRTTSRPESRRK